MFGDGEGGLQTRFPTLTKSGTLQAISRQLSEFEHKGPLYSDIASTKTQSIENLKKLLESTIPNEHYENNAAKVSQPVRLLKAGHHPANPNHHDLGFGGGANTDEYDDGSDNIDLDASFASEVEAITSSPLLPSDRQADFGLEEGEGGHLPVFDTLSPRTKKRIRRLPKPNEQELKNLRHIEAHLTSLGEEELDLDNRSGLYCVLRKNGGPTKKGKSASNMLASKSSSSLVTSPGSNSHSKTSRTLLTATATAPAPFLSQQRHHRQPHKRRRRQQRQPPPNDGLHSTRVAENIEHLHASLNVTERGESLHRQRLYRSIEFAKGQLPDSFLQQNNLSLIRQERGFRVLKGGIDRVFLRYCSGAFRTWLTYVDKVNAFREVLAARRLQRQYRRKLANVEIKERAQTRKIQQDRQRERVLHTVMLRKRAALKIQLLFRGHIARAVAFDKFLRQRSIVVVQMSFRVSRSRAVTGVLRAKERARQVAATDIQRSFRGWLARCFCRLQRKLNNVEQLRQKQDEHCQEVVEEFRCHGAAIKIQSRWRRNQMWKYFYQHMRVAKYRRARIVQRTYMRYRARMQLRKRIRARKELEALRQSSSIIIQQIFRGYSARKVVDLIHLDNDRAVVVRTMEKQIAFVDRIYEYTVPRLQRKPEKTEDTKGFEIVKVKKTLSRNAVKRNATAAKRNCTPGFARRRRRSAIRIQKFYRGYRARGRMRKRRAWMMHRQRQARRDRINTAALDIQRMWRGSCGRLMAQQKAHGESAVTIEKLFRGFHDRQRVRVLRRQIYATTIVQRHWRGYVKRTGYNKYREVTRVQQQPAIRLQAVARMLKARDLVAELRQQRRLKAELKLQASASEAMSQQRALHRFVLESAYGAVRRGGMLDIFHHWSMGKKTLDNSSFVKMFKETPHFFTSTFNQTDLDLTFAKVTGKNKHVDYAQFIQAVDLINATRFGRCKKFRGYHGKEARMLKLVYDLLYKAKWAKKIKKQNDSLVREIQNVKATMISRNVRRLIAQRDFQKRKLERIRLNGEEQAIRAATVIQSAHRARQAKRVIVTLMKAIYVKYIDPKSGDPYWSNPRTGIVSWQKPKLFGDEDNDVSTVLPDSETEFVVHCAYCEEAVADVVCNECNDPYCRACFKALHLKGHRRHHQPNTIDMCGVCNYQMATRVCIKCSAEKHKKVSFCDVCWQNAHVQIDSSKQHQGRPLITMCVECKIYVCRWSCHECQDVYCTACFSRVHKRGKKALHTYEALAYFTPTLADNYERELRENVRRKRREKELASGEMKVMMEKQKAATRIQQMYRGCLGRLQGKAFLKLGRQGIRKAWRQRKKDNKRRSSLLYLLKNVVGKAPPLQSDTREELVMRQIPQWLRNKARVCIGQNVDDEGWLDVEKRTDRKKVAKTGFDVGSATELLEQALWRGVRLPGRVTIKRGERVIATTYDLSSHLIPHSRVRINNLRFSVADVGGGLRTKKLSATEVPIERFWREEDAVDVVMYRMPEPSRKGKLYLKMCSMLLFCQLTQAFIGGYIGLHGSQFKAYSSVAKKLNKKKGRVRSKIAGRCDRRAKKHEKKMSKAKLLLKSSLQQAELAEAANSSDSKAAEEDEMFRIQQAKQEARAAAYMDNAGEQLYAWQEFTAEDGTTKWRHSETGEVRDEKPEKEREEMTAAELKHDAARQRIAAAREKRANKGAKGGKGKRGKR